MRDCEICSQPARNASASYCARCVRLVGRVGPSRDYGNDALKRALKSAWDGQVFRCHYSSAELVVDDPTNPRYLTFDHRTPPAKGDLVVAAAVINDMKTDMSEKEFERVVIELAKKFSGGPFDKEVLLLRHWKR